jgi:hypothetical protein
MPDCNGSEKFDIKKLPRFEIRKPIDRLTRMLLVCLSCIVPAGLRDLVSGGELEARSAFLIGICFYAVLTVLYCGGKYHYVLDRGRNALFRVTGVFDLVWVSFVCKMDDIVGVAVDSLEHTGEAGNSTGRFWFESCLILKNETILRLHKTFDDSYDEIEDAQQYAEYIGCCFYAPKTGREMKVCRTPTGETVVEFTRPGS